MKLPFICLLIFCSFTLKAVVKESPHEIHWNYDGENGPLHWGEKGKNFQSCKMGRVQSPVNIRDIQSKDSESLRFQYNSVPLKIVNNGHTIEINYSQGSYFFRTGKKYELKQFHFHAPSEHAINGTHYPLEVHLVHTSADGHFAVVSVFVKEGSKNDFLEGIWSHISEAKGKEAAFNEQINALFFIPSTQDHYYYAGSLTTPPCTENVEWIIFNEPIELSHAQLQVFQKFYNHNSRPIQRDLINEKRK